jgi:hypothetical protein
MIENLALSVVMVIATVTVHFGGLLALLFLLRRHGSGLRVEKSPARQGLVILLVMIGIFAIHTVEIWLYAVVFFLLGTLPDFETALYFSTSTFSSVGYGDIVLPVRWRLFGTIEAPNGLILIAWSTAFLISLMSRLRALEHDWLEERRNAPD